MFRHSKPVKLSLLSFTFAASLLCSGPIRAQSLPTSVCNVPLSESVAQVLRTVEHEFGKPIVCKETDSTGDYRNANALVLSLGTKPTVRPDGTALGIPVIVLNRAPWRTDSEILHELLHLDLIAHGFPANIGIRPLPPGIDRNALASAGPILQEMIEHRIFYPKMRRMGFDPDMVYRDQLETVLSSTDMSIWNHTPILRALHYAYASLTVADVQFRRELDTAYRNKGWTDDAATGRRLRDAVSAAMVKTGDGEAKALLTCLNILFDNKFTVRWHFEGANLYLGS